MIPEKKKKHLHTYVPQQCSASIYKCILVHQPNKMQLYFFPGSFWNKDSTEK